MPTKLSVSSIVKINVGQGHGGRSGVGADGNPACLRKCGELDPNGDVKRIIGSLMELSTPRFVFLNRVSNRAYEMLKKLFLTLSKLPPFLMLALILGLSVIITQVVMTQLSNVNSTTALGSSVSGPQKIIGMAVFSFLLTLLLPILSLRLEYGNRKKARLGDRHSKWEEILNVPMEATYPILITDAWSRIKSNIAGEAISVPDVRTTHWEVAQVDENRKQVHLVLTYVHAPLGRKASEIRPRQLFCTVNLVGQGTRSQIRLIFKAQSPMDFRTVCEIIEQTKSTMKLIIETVPV